MGFRFFRRVRLLPGLSLNLSKGGLSLSAGVPGARLTVGTSGVRATAGIPGTGLYYTEKLDGRAGGARRRRGRAPAAPSAPSRGPLDLSWFDRLIKPKSEERWIDGLRALLEGRGSDARRELEGARRGPDRDLLLAFLRLRDEDLGGAEALFESALRAPRLGAALAALGLEVELRVPISEHVSARVGPDRRGALIGLAEARQHAGDLDGAIAALDELAGLEPGDPALAVSRAELLLERAAPGDLEAVVALAAGVENESAVHAALLLHGGRALRLLGLPTGARDALTKALRRRKGRPAELLRDARYERALCYEALGQRSRARQELERVYAEDPDHEDTAQRLGLG
jgi:tetratricopeptide (TPR) repeat protein